MAHLLKSQTSFRQIWRRRWLIAGFIFLGAVGLWLSGWELASILLAILAIPFLKESEILDAGAAGESAVSRLLLKQLDDSWYLINDCVVNNAQIDHILIGPSGVFVIETKNYKGDVYGGREDHNWTKIRLGRVKTFYNPVKQSKTHAFRLSDILRAGDFDYFVFALVVFSGRPVELKISAGDFPVLYPHQLKSYLLSHHNRLTVSRVKEVAEYILKNIK